MMNFRNYPRCSAHVETSVKEESTMEHFTTFYRQGQSKMRPANLVAAVALLSMFCFESASAQGVVRAWGMGGTGAATSRGLEAVAFNPANLAFSHGTTVGLAAVAVDVHNNSFSLDRYNAVTGQYLNSADKAELLSDIPDNGLKLDADLNASALGFQMGSFAFSLNGIGAGQGNLDKDYFDLVLNGNQLGQSIDFSNTWGDGYAVGTATVSYGRVIRDTEDSQLSLGLNARYLQGFYEIHVDEAYGVLNTNLTEISGEAFVATQSSQGGQGYGLDIGLAYRTAAGWDFGLTFDNVLGRISWTEGLERQEMRVTANDVNLLNGDLNKAVADADTTFAGESYTTHLPQRARLGAARQFGNFMVAADYIQGFSERGITSTHPLLNTGVEWQVASFFAPRVGLSSGGERGNSASVGVGLKLGPWQVDAAAIARSGLTPGASKGLGVAFGSVLQF